MTKVPRPGFQDILVISNSSRCLFDWSFVFLLSIEFWSLKVLLDYSSDFLSFVRGTPFFLFLTSCVCLYLSVLFLPFLDFRNSSLNHFFVVLFLFFSILFYVVLCLCTVLTNINVSFGVFFLKVIYRLLYFSR